MNVDIQVSTKTAEHRETHHIIDDVADLTALIADEKAKHQDVTSVTVVIVE